MAKKKGSVAADKDLKATVKTLRSDLATTKAKLKQAKKKAARLERSLSDSKSQVKKLKKASTRSRESVPPVAESSAVEPSADSAAPAEISQPASSTRDVTPDDSWTVVQLRAAARSRGLTGLSGKPKADLLSALT